MAMGEEKIWATEMMIGMVEVETSIGMVMGLVEILMNTLDEVVTKMMITELVGATMSINLVQEVRVLIKKKTIHTRKLIVTPIGIYAQLSLNSYSHLQIDHVKVYQCR